ncbi:protein of unknown function DUF461 [Thermocrinis albus DSM 14484]|uniref:Copper chaperone PCu(A)C n=1 Tax=Thermocrinis albus (strain DSM 14484 / JCM 11386 / HI 11/12) TaxID=638303 RepID=D3SM45_THEAH|nr:copper chaperone PCu(A)C [Thermocrinis albus]ADC89825.1 protein of unknown function DUF461 [Thermocrinis albus DSM 14484]
MRNWLVGLALLGSAFAQPKVEVRDAWVRAVPPVSKVSAAYMVLKNNGDKPEKLLSASSSVAHHVELHETQDGKMRRVKFIEIPPGSQVELKPGGYHIMLIGLKKPLKEGEKVSITLHFESGKLTVEAPVKKSEDTEEHHHH